MTDDATRAGDAIRLGVLLPTGRAQLGTADPRELITFGMAAESLGLDSLWVNDTLLSPRVEALAMLSALAAVTTRPVLGTAALLPVLRRPVQAAQALASVHALSGGRLTVAVGAGFPGRFGQPLYEISEVPWPRRFARLDDTVALWRQLWSGTGPDSFHGQVLHLDSIPAAILPVPPGATGQPGPPVWLGGASPAALARTGGRYDGWLPYPPDPADYRAGLAQVRQAAASADRDPAAITPAVFVTVLVTDAADGGRQALGEFSQANYGLPLDALRDIQAVVAGPAARVAEDLARYVDAGARHLVCRLAAASLPAQREQLDRLAALAPALRPQAPLPA